MNFRQLTAALSLSILCGALALGAEKRQVSAATKSPDSEPPKAVSATPPIENGPEARVVRYGERDIIPIKAILRHTTMIVLPKDEEILDFACGDKEFWIVNGNHNFAYIKPAKPGSRTTLNLITASGNVYSFLLAEVSESPKTEADFKVFVEAKEESMVTAAALPPKFVSAQAMDDLRRELQNAKDELLRTKEAAKAAVDAGIAKFLDNVRFPYRFEAGKKPFYIRAMYHDDKFTYLQARPEETPALYEIKDGQPNLINFDYKNGVYVVDKILDQGYLTIGKQKQSFSLQE